METSFSLSLSLPLPLPRLPFNSLAQKINSEIVLEQRICPGFNECILMIRMGKERKKTNRRRLQAVAAAEFLFHFLNFQFSSSIRILLK